MKLLIIGGSGLLGKKLIEYLKKNKHIVYATYYTNYIKCDNFFQLDITSKDSVYDILKKINPDVVIHTAAYTDVDGCEKNQKKAFDVNVKGTINISNAAEKIQAKIVYISTDYVFSGEEGNYKEKDLVNPINFYGITKLKGEEEIKKIFSDYLIARTSVIYGGNKNNFALWAIDKLEKGEELGIVTDQFVSPTLNIDLAEQLVALVDGDYCGVFHTAGGERISRYDFVRVIADVFDFDESLIVPLKMEDMGWVARRSRDSSLDVSKISKIKKPYKVRDAVKMLQDELGI